jgi:hypothetical protein
VTGGIVFANIGLGFDDDPGRPAPAHLVHEHLADQIFEDLKGGASVKRRRKGSDPAGVRRVRPR